MITDPKSITGEMNVFPSKLKTLRTAYGYSQQQVADMLGVSRPTYANYESGKKSPYLNNLYKLAEIFKVSVDSLVSQTAGVEIGSGRESELLKYLHDNNRKLKPFSADARELMYYYENMSERDRQEILEICKIKSRNQ